MKIISIVGMFFVLCMGGWLQGVPREGNPGKIVNLFFAKKKDDHTTSRILRLAKDLLSHELDQHFFDDGFDRVDQVCQGATLLHLAVLYGNAEIVQALVLAGANLDEKNFRGHTPRELAIALGKRHLLYLFEDCEKYDLSLENLQ